MRLLFLLLSVYAVTGSVDCRKSKKADLSEYYDTQPYPKSIPLHEKFQKEKKNIVTDQATDFKWALTIAKMYATDAYAQPLFDWAKAFSRANKDWTATKVVVMKIYTDSSPNSAEIRSTFWPPCNDERLTKKRGTSQWKWRLYTEAMEWCFAQETKEIKANPESAKALLVAELYLKTEVTEKQTKRLWYGFNKLCFDLFRFGPTWAVYGPMSTSSEKHIGRRFAGEFEHSVLLEVEPEASGPYYPIPVFEVSNMPLEVEWLFFNPVMRIVRIERGPTKEKNVLPVKALRKTLTECTKEFTYETEVFAKKPLSHTFREKVVDLAKQHSINEAQELRDFLKDEEYDSDAILADLSGFQAKFKSIKASPLKQSVSSACVYWRFGGDKCLLVVTEKNIKLLPVLVFEELGTAAGQRPDKVTKLTDIKGFKAHVGYTDTYEYETPRKVDTDYYDNGSGLVDLSVYVFISMAICCIICGASFLCGIVLGTNAAKYS